MIGKLKGLVDEVGEDFVVLDVGGVGYLVHCSARTLRALPSPGEAAALAIETYVREDMIRLYGFRSEPEREWFRLLQSVQGVGAKVALAILSVLDPDGLARAIAGGDKASVAQAPGVGPKLAARIVAEMKGKGPAMGPPLGGAFAPAASGSSDPLDAAPSPASDAVAALVRLGYPQPRASAAVAAAMRAAGEDAETQTLLRLSLRDLAQG